jgi:predicted lipoprotein with Yx(FWY)xxD motif
MNVKILRSNSNRYQLWLVAVALLALIGLIAAGSGFAGASHTTSTAVVKTRKISGLGVVLVNKNGRTLYIFMKDKHRKVTCTGACTSFWKALKWKGSGKPKAGGAAKSKLLGVVKSSSGKVVTYNHWPLYTYVGDSKAGQAKGEGSTLNGSKWYVMSAKGTIVKHKSSGGGGGTTTTGGGGWG